MKASARLLPLLALAALAAGADETRVRAEVDARKVGLEDQFQLRIVVDGSGDVSQAPMPSALKNLRLLSGPMVSQQVSIVNAADTSSVRRRT